jgi:MFS family permease
MFILIIWLQGIYLPIHGYSFERTQLWAGIAMLPLTVGFLIAGPASGWLSDRFGFAIAACLVAAVASLLRGRRYVHEEHGAAMVAAPDDDGAERLQPQSAG